MRRIPFAELKELMAQYIAWLDEVGMNDLHRVGGKNASLGEMISNLSDLGVRVPGGFATTSEAFLDFLSQSGLQERINAELSALDVEDVAALAVSGKNIREWVLGTRFQPALQQAVEEAWSTLCQRYGEDPAVAVRSSATAEDLPDASFAGQQETFLNVRGLDRVLETMHEVFASLYNDRAIAYRVHQGFAHNDVSLSAGVQLMVRSDRACSGVMFTADTESGFDQVVFITASWGLGETIVQGAVNPDEYYAFKPSLLAERPAVLRRTRGGKAIKMIYGESGGVETVDVPSDQQESLCLDDAEIETLARQAIIIERHYGRPMDIEWAKDGVSGELFIVQARPETVNSQLDHGQSIERFRLLSTGTLLCEGRSIGNRIGVGRARVVASHKDMNAVQPGDVLVTDMTDPDWEPIMKRASAIVTNRGGRTCHAAIIARELAIPAVVGCKTATTDVPDGEDVTVSCAEGEAGHVYLGRQEFKVQKDDLEGLPPAPIKIMMNVANPDRAFDFCMLPNHGVGLARLEFIINRMIGIHPRALLELDQQDAEIREQIRHRIAGYENPESFYVQRLAEGISTIAAAFAPKPVIVRLSDFKSNEYANLIGGARYEPHEDNPMLGFRGAARYLSDQFKDCFELECRALRFVREEMGLDNTWAMVPFVRTVEEGRGVLSLMSDFGLPRVEGGMPVIMMCELPSNVLLADEFLEYFDGFSIGSNDLTQLTLGLDRDSADIASLFDERNPAVTKLLSMAIQSCVRKGKYIGICGQGPSDHPDLAEWLVGEGIESISLNPDTVIETWLQLARLSNGED